MATPSSFAPASAHISHPELVGRSGQLIRAGYWGMHLACLGVLFVDVSATLVAACVASVFVRMFGITGGYHRYFSHRTYKTGRVMQMILALLGCAAMQKGPLWWASIHRQHHRFADLPDDPHSPRAGFAKSHFSWIFESRWRQTDPSRVRDLCKFPELVWLDRFDLTIPIALGVACFALGGAAGLVYGFVLPTVLLWHGTYTINSLAHVYGKRRYETDDDSRNNVWLALLTLGEGWHNNHHHYMNSTRQGFFWWEVDVTYYVLRALAFVGLVWDIREPPDHVVRGTSAAG